MLVFNLFYHAGLGFLGLAIAFDQFSVIQRYLTQPPPPDIIFFGKPYSGGRDTPEEDCDEEDEVGEIEVPESKPEQPTQ